jgi:beta-mannosidase
MVKQSLAGEWQFREFASDGWLPAQVPGSVHTDLLALGRIPDPFVADDELHVQWVAERDWEYGRTFQVAPELEVEKRVFLVCDGLDTLADVNLDGRIVGHAQNAFRRYEWDVTSLLTGGKHELRIYFPSPIAYVRPRQAEQPMGNPAHSIPGGPYLRKAPCQFGWDWGPQLPPIGIWKDIRLEAYSVARLADVHLRQHHADGAVTITADVISDRWQQADLKATLRLTAPDGSTQESEIALSGNTTTGTLAIRVVNPQLWWPNGYPSASLRTGGAQPLYRVEVALYQGETLRDRRTFQMGLRTLELRQQPDKFGTSFVFIVNGVPVFAKGANWIPADSFPTRIGDDHLEHLVRSAAQANMNMLRVWGGGFYEEERFYDLCDRYGILIWQDFIFSCSTYPEAESFFENVRVEAVENVRRLRHRASLALWCGNNEMEGFWERPRWTKRPGFGQLKAAYDRMFHHFLPEICASEDPDHPYWPSSPSSNTPFVDDNGGRAGDTHCWAVWHGMKPFGFYREHPTRFVSEFGFQSLPPLATIRTYADEADWNMTSYMMEHHQRNAAGNGKIVTYMTAHFRLPKDFESLVYLSQVLQAECVRTGVEHWRRNKQRVGGALYWQLNDCWPVASWASLDYFGRWKALHYAARRFYAPVLLSAEDEGTRVALHVTSDLLDAWQGRVRWSLETLAGEVLRSGEEAVTVTALASVQVCALDFSDCLTAGPSITISANIRRDLVLVYELWQGDQRLSMDVLPFVPNKHLELADPKLRATIKRAKGGLAVEVTARRLARFVALELEGSDAIFSDNYFDLPAGRTATVTLPAPKGWTLKRVREQLCAHSLFDSF